MSAIKLSSILLQATMQALSKMGGGQLEEELRSAHAEDLDIPPEQIDFDLCSAVAIKASSCIGCAPNALADAILSTIQNAPDGSDCANLISQSVVEGNGYLNVRLTQSAITSWIASTLFAANIVAPSIANQLIRELDVEVSKRKIDPKKVQAIESTADRCQKIIESASQTQFDLEHKIEHPPLIDVAENEYLQRTGAWLAREGQRQQSKLSGNEDSLIFERKMILSLCLLADDLTPSGMHSPALCHGEQHQRETIRLHRVLRHAYGLNEKLALFLADNAVVNRDTAVTQLHLAVILASARLLAFSAGLLRSVVRDDVANIR